VPNLTVADLTLAGTDATGAEVTTIYAKNPPLYAVYRTKERVLVQFADDPAKAGVQRTALASLNPLRGEINGLVDGWRASKQEALRFKAVSYDRRSADALVMALEGDVHDAGLLLGEIKQDLLDERTARARVDYLLAACAVLLAALLVAWAAGRAALSNIHPGDSTLYPAIWIGAGAGAIGAFFSIAVGLRARTVLTDLHKTENSCDAGLRMTIGYIAAAILISLLGSGLVHLSLGTAPIDLTAPPPASDTSGWWMKVLVVGFVAGFSERMVPDILAKATGLAGPPAPSTSERLAGAPVSPGAKAMANTPPLPVQPPSDDEADSCLCDAPVSDHESTHDADLPAASGGVAAPANA
jgi:hypothetical protein